VKRLVLALLAAWAAAVPSLAEEDRDKKDQVNPPLQHEIVVTATRIATPAFEVASSVTVITRRELERAGRAGILDILRGAAGLDTVRNGGPGASSSIFLRGGNSEHLLVLLDGIALNDPMNPSRSFDLTHLTLDDVERIEILRGPQSTLYGSDALAGVINILTRRGEGKPSLSLEASGGAYGTARGSVRLAGSAGPAGFSLALSGFRTSGFSAADDTAAGNTEKDGYQNVTASGNLVLTLSPVSEAGLSVRTTWARTDLDAFGGPGGDDPNSLQDYDSFFIRAHGRALLLGGRWETRGDFSFIRSNRENENPTDSLHPFDAERGRFRSSLVKIDWQNNVFLHPSHTMTLGAEAEREQGDSSYVSESLWGTSESLFPSRRADRAGLYLQDQIRIGGRFFATAGVRLEEHSRTGTSFTFRLAPAFLLAGTGTKLKATLGTGFKAPSLYQLYAPATAWGPIGNEALKPERCTGWDAGIEQTFSGGRAGLTYFRNDYRGLMDFDFLVGYINIGRARTEGLELFAEARPGKDLDLRFSYTRMKAMDADAETPLPRRPRDKASADIRWRLARRWEAGLSGLFVGDRPDRDYSAWPYPAVTLKRYFLVDADVVLDLSPRTQFFIRVENILNEKYQTVFGYGTPRRSIYAGIRLKGAGG